MATLRPCGLDGPVFSSIGQANLLLVRGSLGSSRIFLGVFSTPISESKIVLSRA